VRSPAAALLIALAGVALAAPGAEPTEVSAEDLMTAGDERLSELQEKLVGPARARFEALTETRSWTPEEVEALLGLLLVDPVRATTEPLFLERVLPVAEAAVGGAARSPAEAVAALERLELSWRTLERSSLERRVEPEIEAGSSDGLAWADLEPPPAEGELALSIYSLGSDLFDRESSESFLRGLREAAPDRRVALLVDRAQEQELTPLARELDLHLTRTWGRLYSPWPRDAMGFLAAPGGGRVAVLRPNRQPGREHDSFMALELIQDLPAAEYEVLGPLSWAVAPIPFHNGNILRTGGRLWISIHSLEPRILELLGLDRVPVESFGSVAGVDRYIAAARHAAGELERLFGAPVAFVHPLPEGDDPAAAAAAMERLGGGAGVDLDSVVTLVSGAPGKTAALVADPRRGATLVGSASVAELDVLRATYGLAPAASELGNALGAAQSDDATTALASFLDLIAEHLEAGGIEVQRLPLLRVPSTLLADPGATADPAFLIGWNNVVLERRGELRRAEGFASGLAGGDALAREGFAGLGYELDLLPPLIPSVLRNGGYRCASNHLRALRSD
jgi:hypothetical protein